MINLRMSAMKRRLLILSMTAFASWAGAQQDGEPGAAGVGLGIGGNPPPSGERPRNPEDRGRGPRPPGERDRRFEGENGPMRGGRGGDMFRRLTEEERKRVREAFEKVWIRPEVEAAKGRLREANDEYRKAIDAALLAVDPEVVKILNRVRPVAPPLPERNDPEFARKMWFRLRTEGPFRGETGGEELNEKVLNHPVVSESLTKLYEASPEQRRRAWEEFRESYFRILREVNQPAPDKKKDGKENSDETRSGKPD